MSMPADHSCLPPARVVHRRVALLVALWSAMIAAGCGSSKQGASAKAPYRQPLYPTYVQQGQVAAIDRVRLGRSPTQRSAVINAIPGGGAPYALDDGVSAGQQDEGLDPKVRIPRGPDGPDIYRITVKMHDGYVRSFDYEQLGGLRLGDRVRVEQDQISRY